MTARALACLAAATLLVTSAPLFASDVIGGSATWSAALPWGNGHKIDRGKYNSLHAIYREGTDIAAYSSADGDNWVGPSYLNTSSNETSSPAIAVDGAGTAAAVWWQDDGSPLGGVYYAYRPVASATWTTSHLVLAGKEPTITARGSKVYVAWSTGNSIQYTTFSTVSPPASPLVLGEVVEQTSCPNTTLTLPSIAVIRDPCNPPLPQVAYLLAADEQANPDPFCHAASTHVGPKVESRSGGSWSVVYDGTQTDSSLISSVVAVSLSLAAHYSTGNLYLAWSDEQTGTARTMAATGKGATWSSTPISSERNHVHVRANDQSWAAAGEFRLSWGHEGDFSDAYTRRGTWGDGIPLAWSGLTTLSTANPVRLPQGVFWRWANLYGSAVLSNYFEEETANPITPPRVVTNYFSSQLTWLPSTGKPFAVAPCEMLQKISVGIVHLGDGSSETAVDFADFGELTKLSEGSATLTTYDGKTVSISWTDGRLVRAWDTGLVVTAPRQNVRFSSRDTRFEVQEDGELVELEAR